MRGPDVDEIARLIRLYLPSAPAMQLAGDLYRSKAAGRDPHLKEVFRQLRERLAAEPPSYKMEGHA